MRSLAMLWPSWRGGCGIGRIGAGVGAAVDADVADAAVACGVGFLLCLLLLHRGPCLRCWRRSPIPCPVPVAVVMRAGTRHVNRRASGRRPNCGVGLAALARSVRSRHAHGVCGGARELVKFRPHAYAAISAFGRNDRKTRALSVRARGGKVLMQAARSACRGGCACWPSAPPVGPWRRRRPRQRRRPGARSAPRTWRRPLRSASARS